MPFRCPACSRTQSLEIVGRLELPPDARSDEITLQVVRCARCDYLGIAVYEESRRGALDDDSFSHTGYRIDAREWQALKRDLARCPEPGNPRCTCAVHQKYGRRNAAARWDGLKDLSLSDPYAIVR